MIEKNPSGTLSEPFRNPENTKTLSPAPAPAPATEPTPSPSTATATATAPSESPALSESGYVSESSSVTERPSNEEEISSEKLQSTNRQRHEVIRTGPRAVIPRLVRWAVGRRDNHVCRICHRELRGREYDLDHIVPWSAGGSDESTNLRVACKWCNFGRSNFVDENAERPPNPATWWCADCWGDDPDPWHPLPFAERVDGTDVVAYCAKCRYLSRTDQTVDNFRLSRDFQHSVIEAVLFKNLPYDEMAQLIQERFGVSLRSITPSGREGDI